MPKIPTPHTQKKAYSPRKKTAGNTRKKYAPPKSHDEAVERIVKLTNHLYNYKGDTRDMALALTQAAATMTAEIEDHNDRKKILIESYDSLYEWIKDL